MRQYLAFAIVALFSARLQRKKNNEEFSGHSSVILNIKVDNHSLHEFPSVML